MPLSTLSRAARRIAVVGAGPAGLMAAETLSAAGVAVTVYDRMPSPARKFLLAGRGGLNLTHSEAIDAFASRYEGPPDRVRAVLDEFSPDALRAWCESLGVATFVGSSGRVFPRSMKSSPVVRAWLARLTRQGVAFRFRHRLTDWQPGRVVFDTPEGEVSVAADATVLALGGASWPRLGSDGGWVEFLRRQGCAVAPLEAANVGIEVAWSQPVIALAGTPLKNVTVSIGARSQRGELVISRRGLEGGPIYALGPAIRHDLAQSGSATLQIDLKPDLDGATLAIRLAERRAGQTLTGLLHSKARLTPAAIAMLREATGNKLPGEAPALAALIKAVPITTDKTQGLERAISTAGGLRWSELDDNLMISRAPGLFAAGEMLEGDAPTGGYLLQMSFATGHRAAIGVLDWLASPSTRSDPITQRGA